MAVFLVGCKEAGEIKQADSDAPETEILFSQKAEDPIERFDDLLVAVQMQRIFPDGKTFVDAIPKTPADSILTKYDALKDTPGFKLKAFVLDNFTFPKESKAGFKSDTSQTITEHIDALWPYLKQQPDETDAGSLIALPNPYIIPGGRFREVYYWDSFFILLGLKEAGETDLIEDILDNFAYQIETFGFIPNGNRTYYTGRSQPPFFAEMVKLLATIQPEKEVYARYKNALQTEYDFWMEGADELEKFQTYKRVVWAGYDHILNRYWSNTQTPRAESYREDILTAQKDTMRNPERVYLNISAACESGWDFSSRWLDNASELSTIRTTNIIPVDLNSLLYNLELVLAKAYSLSGEDEVSKQFAIKAEARKKAVNFRLWDTSANVYQDFDYKKGNPTETLSLAMVYPLYFGLASPEQAEAIAAVLEKDFLKPGGLITTLNTTGQQWDAPNGWPPLQWLAIRGLERYGLTTLANKIESRWLTVNERVYKHTGKLLEKYNVVDTTLTAGGGEYPTQDGFGWTNGVYLDLINN